MATTTPHSGRPGRSTSDDSPASAIPPGRSAGGRSGSTSGPKWQMPPLDTEDKWLTGVAAGIAHEIGVQPLVIRASFVLLFAAGGWAGVLYLFAWFAMERSGVSRDTYVAEPKGASTGHRHVGVGMVVLGVLLVLRLFDIGFVGGVVWPAGFVFVGALIAWSHGREADEDGQGVSQVARVVAGSAVGVGGLLAFGAAQFQFRDAALALIFSLAVLAGIAVIAAPSIIRIGADLDTARKDKVRADERARFAAHLHDSVLQTLSLIQRHADDAETTSALARRQERELRNWLYHSAAQVGFVRLSHALNDMASLIEHDHRIPVEVVVVGDEAFEAMADKNLEALLGATREAITNAAKHSGADRVDVFAEMRKVPDSEEVLAEIFVRDTGTGFDRAEIDEDRRGVVDSIEGRMSRHGGSGTIHSSPGEGTEVELSITLIERQSTTAQAQENQNAGRNRN